MLNWACSQCRLPHKRKVNSLSLLDCIFVEMSQGSFDTAGDTDRERSGVKRKSNFALPPRPRSFHNRRLSSEWHKQDWCNLLKVRQTKTLNSIHKQSKNKIKNSQKNTLYTLTSNKACWGSSSFWRVHLPPIYHHSNRSVPGHGEHFGINKRELREKEK